MSASHMLQVRVQRKRGCVPLRPAGLYGQVPVVAARQFRGLPRSRHSYGYHVERRSYHGRRSATYCWCVALIRCAVLLQYWSDLNVEYLHNLPYLPFVISSIHSLQLWVNSKDRCFLNDTTCHANCWFSHSFSTNNINLPTTLNSDIITVSMF